MQPASRAVYRIDRAGGRAPTLRPGGGLTYAQGPHAKCEKI